MDKASMPGIRKNLSSVFFVSTVAVSALLLGACASAPEDTGPVLVGGSQAVMQDDMDVQRARPAIPPEPQFQPVVQEPRYNEPDYAVVQPVSSPPAMDVEPLMTTPPVAAGVPGSPSGTLVGARVEELRAEVTSLNGRAQNHGIGLEDLQARTERAAADYFAQVAMLNAKLQGGSPPGNPRLVAAHQEAERRLDRLSNDVSDMTDLGTEIAETAQTAEFLANSAEATFKISGAVEEDHEQLAIVEDEIERLRVAIDRQMKIAQMEIDRQGAAIATEQSNLKHLSLAIARGGFFTKAPESESERASMRKPAMMDSVESSNLPTMLSDMADDDAKPLVVIRFDRPTVNFEPALQQAVSGALERAPGAKFDIVAVTPLGAGGPAIATSEARKHAETVAEKITMMGVPVSRISLAAQSSQAATSPEVKVFLR